MEIASTLTLITTGGLLGGAAVFFWAQSRFEVIGSSASAEASAEISRLKTELQLGGKQHAERLAELEARSHEKLSDRENLVQQLQSLLQQRSQNEEQLKDSMREAFKAVNQDVMSQAGKDFNQMLESSLTLVQQRALGDWEVRNKSVETTLGPIQETLGKFDSQLRELEKNREGSYQALQAHLQTMLQGQDKLREETGNLVTALRRPQVRGSWGELKLKQVVEHAGMQEHCDFAQQVSLVTEDGTQRPDLIVNLPGGKRIVVDSKAPLEAYLDALQSDLTEDERKARLIQHARQVRQHIDQLSSKAYWQRLDCTPDFVVLFLPGESFFTAALEHDPGLFEYGMGKRIVLASPFNLITLLRTIAYGWQQDAIHANARDIEALGQELYERLATTTEHLGGLSGALKKSVDCFNKLVGNLETRVMSSARKFKDLGVASPKEIQLVEEITSHPRVLAA